MTDAGQPARGERFATRASRALASGVTRGGLDRAVLGALRSVLRKAPASRLASSLAFHLGHEIARRDRFAVASLETGARMLLDLEEHRNRHILVYGTCEEESTRALTRMAKPGWVFVDVGADGGYYSLLARDLGKTASRILAFEPNPEPARLLHASIAMNEAAGEIQVVAAACGSIPGTRRLHLSAERGNSGLATLVPDLIPSHRSLEVQVVRIDDECARRGLHPDVVKIDVEGAEEDALRGMERLLVNRVPFLVLCEIADDGKRPPPTRLIATMTALGYDAHRIEPDGQTTRLEGRPLRALENLAFLRRAAPDGARG